MKVGINGLEQFPSAEGLPKTEDQVVITLHSSKVKAIKSFALGPEGTNISQACERWINRANLRSKSTMELCVSPEGAEASVNLSVAKAKAVNSEGEIGVFWTCAVYFALNRLFFENPDTLPFFITEVMPLDEMQLATRSELVAKVVERQVPVGWRIASHPSPAPLARNLDREVILVASNAQAAGKCATDEVELCITTESAKKLHKLVTLHRFGSPDMEFFGGITAHGARILQQIWPEVLKSRELE